MKELKLEKPKVDRIINTQVAQKLFEAHGELYNYDDAKNDLVNLTKNDTKMLLKIYKLDSQKFDFALCIENSEAELIAIDKIQEDMVGQMMDSKDSKFFCWITNKCYRKK